MEPEANPTAKNEGIKRKISARELFNSPAFYLALFPHAIALLLVLIGNLEYFYVFFIFFLELIIDIFILSFAVLLIKNELVQKIYKSNYHKSILALRTLIGGLLFCSFFGIFAFLIFYLTGGKGLSATDILTNNIVWLAIGVYAARKMISLIVNKFRYNTGRQLYIEEGSSLMINLVTLIIFVMPGIYIFALLKFLPINVEFIAIIILFVIKAYIDASRAFQEKNAETKYRKLYL